MVKFLLFNFCAGVPGWLSQLSIRFRLRSSFHVSWVRAPCQVLCWQRRACLGSSVSLSLSAPPPLSLSFKKSINIKKNKLNFCAIQDGFLWCSPGNEFFGSGAWMLNDVYVHVWDSGTLPSLIGHSVHLFSDLCLFPRRARNDQVSGEFLFVHLLICCFVF